MESHYTAGHTDAGSCGSLALMLRSAHVVIKAMPRSTIPHSASVEFIPENGEGEGVRRRKADRPA